MGRRGTAPDCSRGGWGVHGLGGQSNRVRRRCDCNQCRAGVRSSALSPDFTGFEVRFTLAKMVARVGAINQAARYSLLVFSSLLALYLICRIQTPFDSELLLPTTISVLREGNFDLDEYAPAVSQVSHGLRKANGHLYNEYPLGPALVAVPFVALTDLTARTTTSIAQEFQLRVPRWAKRWGYHFDSTGDINIDFWNRPQQVIASLLVALTGAFVFLLSLPFLSPPRALLLTAVFGVATPALSSASRALWQHAPSMLFLTLTLWFLLLARKRPAWLACAGVAVALSYLMRPTNSISV